MISCIADVAVLLMHRAPHFPITVIFYHLPGSHVQT